MKFFNKNLRIIITAFVFFFLLALELPIVASAASPITVNLGTARNFVILSRQGSTNTLATPPVASTPNMLLLALNDLQNAYIKTARRTNPTATELSGGNIGGITLTPGIYKWSTGVTMPTDIALSGSADDVWIFQIAGNLDVSPGTSVILSGGAEAQNIFWQVEGQTTIGASAFFSGNILDNSAIVLDAGAKINGRALSEASVTLGENALVTLGENTASVPVPVPVPAIPAVVVPPEVTSSINVSKIVINDNGGTKTIFDFPLFVNGAPVVSGATNVFPVGAYTVTEIGDPNYTRTFSGDCDAGGLLSLAPGDHKICIITNSDIAPAVVEPIVPPPVVTPPADTTAPVISLTGDAIINLNVGDMYNELGATATDNVDSVVPVVITGAVDTATAGTYTVSYNAIDAAGNHAVEVARIINVVTPPVIPPPVSPGLPTTGVPPQNKIDPLNVVLLSGIVALFISLFLVMRKKEI